MFDFHIFLALLSVVLAWKWGDWRNWKWYYPTIMYMILGDLTYLKLSTNKPLWEYKSQVLSAESVEFLIAVVVFPCTCFIYFAIYSKLSKSKQPAYIALLVLFSATIYTAFEWLAISLGFFAHSNGWNIYWTFGFDCLMFLLLIVHYKKPLWVWPPSIILAFLVIYIFDLPFVILK